MIAALRPLMRELAHAYYRWAERDIKRCHPDYPRIVMRLRDLRAEREQGRSL